eukprot:359960_1
MHKQDTDESSNDKIVIFDWDDTLFPMSELQKRSPLPIDLIESLACSVHQLLLKYIHLFGSRNVIIVTNSKKGWVLKSLTILNDITYHNIPSIAALYSLISAEQFTVVSAQSLFSRKHPKQTRLWKKLAFIQLLQDRFIITKCRLTSPNPSHYTLICIGDSNDEYESCMLAAKWMNERHHQMNLTVHRIKLKSHPKLKYMLNQIKLLEDFAAVFHSVQIAIDVDYHQEMLQYMEGHK